MCDKMPVPKAQVKIWERESIYLTEITLIQGDVYDTLNSRYRSGYRGDDPKWVDLGLVRALPLTRIHVQQVLKPSIFLRRVATGSADLLIHISVGPRQLNHVYVK